MRAKSLLAAAASFAAIAASTVTAAIVEGIGQRGSTDLPSFDRIATYATNGAGLFGNDHTEIPNGTMWLSAAGDTAGAFEIDLGAVYAIDSIRVWNYNEINLVQRGVVSADIEVGLTTADYVPKVTGQVFAQAPGTNTDFSEVINLLGARGRFIRIDILGNYGDPGYTGLSEIQVEGTLVSGQKPLAASIFEVSSTIGAPYNRAAEHAIDYSGVFSLTHSITPDGNMWLGSLGDVTPTITFDLGSSQSLSNMLFWNYNEALPNRVDLLDRGVSQGDILLSNDGVNFLPFASDVAFPMGPGDNTTDFAQNINLTGATARYVQIAVDANWGNANYTGISEVQFFAVPEPSAACLVAATPLATLLFSRRRRS